MVCWAAKGARLVALAMHISPLPYPARAAHSFSPVRSLASPPHRPQHLAPAGTRLPLRLLQVFESDRQKSASGGDGTIMTRIIAERTSHLTPGTAFLGAYEIVDGIRTTNTSVVRCVMSYAMQCNALLS